MLSYTGLSHRHAPLRVRERCAVPAAERDQALADLRRRLGNAVLLSTCGRTEIYADTDDADLAEHEATGWLARHARMAETELRGHLEQACGDEVVRRIVRVACGLESALEGENEILGQVRRAWLDAASAGVLSPALDAAFRLAVRTGRQVRRIGDPRPWTSLANSAAAQVAAAVHHLAMPRVLIAGTGPMGLHTAGALRERFGDCLQLTVAGRTPERVMAHAQQLGARPICLDGIPAALNWADAAVFGLRTPRPIVGPADLAARMPERPLLIVDLSVPRSVEDAVGRQPDVSLYNVDDLGGSGHGRWDTEGHDEVERVVGRALDGHAALGEGAVAATALATLRMQAERIRRMQLERTLRRLPQLDEQARQAMDAMTRAIVNRLLHDPTMRLKADPHGEPARQLRELFGIAELHSEAGAPIPQ